MTVTQSVVDEALASPGEYLSFSLGNEEYGIPILSVQEIRGYTEPTRLANAPEHFLGVLNLRGTIVPIMDLRFRLLSAKPVYNELTVTIVLNIGGDVVGIVVDSVSDVIALTNKEIKPTPGLSGVSDASFINGIATVEDPGHSQLLLLLDIASLVTGAELRTYLHD